MWRIKACVGGAARLWRGAHGSEVKMAIDLRHREEIDTVKFDRLVLLKLVR